MNLKTLLTLLVAYITFIPCVAQRSKIDSMQRLLQTEKLDSNKVNLLWKLADLYQANRPATALALAHEAYSLSVEIKYIEGQSRSLNQIAKAFNMVGNYPKALEYYIKKLKIEEQRHYPENLAIAYINIATVYLYQKEYRKALDNTFIADSVIVANDIKRLRMFSLLNIGDIYEKYNKLDSAMEFSNKAYESALQAGDDNMTGSALNNFANICLKLGTLDLALKNYRKALPLLIKTQDEDVICETTIGLAKTFQKLSQPDSALHYARYSFMLSKADGFLGRNLEASTFLKDYFNQRKLIDSAYKYQQEMMAVKDSISSTERIKEGQLIALNEQVRQKELSDLKLKEKYELKKRLQYISIGVLIPVLFLLTMNLRNKKIKPRFVESMGLFSLLMFFEYITLLLHPVVSNFTNHVPVFELFIFTAIAALLTRTHHRIEHWFLGRLTHTHHKQNQH